MLFAIAERNHREMTSNHYLTLDEKVALMNDYADGAGLSQRKLCEKYKVSKADEVP